MSVPSPATSAPAAELTPLRLASPLPVPNVTPSAAEDAPALVVAHPARPVGEGTGAGLTLNDLSFFLSARGNVASAASPGASPGAAASTGWRTISALRSHVDGVRAVAWHPTEPLLVSASEDGTAKLWQLSAVAKTVAAGMRPVDDGKTIEPLFTYRGHRGPIISTAFAPTELGLFATGGLDGSVCVWQLPPPSPELYACWP